jgi:hypothetical protein
VSLKDIFKLQDVSQNCFRQNPEVLPNVTKVNTRHRLEVLQGTKLNHECMNTIVLATDYQTSHQD